MFEFHKDKSRYFNMQRQVTLTDVIPFVEAVVGKLHGKRVLEIGCAEAGVLKAFIDHGNTGAGVELSQYRYELACQNLSTEVQAGKAKFYNKNIYDIIDPSVELGGLFDLIVLKDVIEHIPEQKKFIASLHRFLLPGGSIFFAYPPWWMPFGGHQQICTNSWLQKIPWIHLLPFKAYRFLLKKGGESELTIQELMDIKKTGILMEQLVGFVRKAGYTISAEKHWLVNPIYQFKFGWKKRLVPGFLTRMLFIRNFYTTAHYLLFHKASS